MKAGNEEEEALQHVRRLLLLSHGKQQRRDDTRELAEAAAMQRQVILEANGCSFDGCFHAHLLVRGSQQCMTCVSSTPYIPDHYWQQHMNDMITAQLQQKPALVSALVSALQACKRVREYATSSSNLNYY